jgi:hypothetical protein
MTFGEFTPSDAVVRPSAWVVLVKEVGATLSKILFYGLVHEVFILGGWFVVRLLKNGE